MICNHCGKTLENESQLFCAFCGYPVGDVRRGFFTKTEETGELPADESAIPPNMMAQPAQPVPQPAMPQSAQMSMPMGMMGMMPQMSMMQGMMPYMAMMQGMMPNLMSQMNPMQGQQNHSETSDSEQPETMQANQQQMFQNATMMMGMAGMPQMMGYDASGNPIYIQMMPQVMGYDPYGNPIYAMIPVQCAMPQMQNHSNQQANPDDSAPSRKTVSAQGRAISQPMAKKKPSVPKETQPAQPESLSASQPQTPPPPSESEPTPQEKPRVANAYRVGQAPQEGFFARQVRMQNPVANGVGIKPAEKKRPEPEPLSEQPEPAEEMPVSVDTLIMEQEAQFQNLPNEQELLDSIFSDRSKKYTLTEDVDASSSTFSISLSASEVTTVRRRTSGIVPDTLEKVPSPPQSEEERLFSKVEKDLPPPMAMYDKPPQKDPSEYSRSKSRHQPFQPQNNNSWQYQQTQPYSQPSATSQYQQAQPYSQPSASSQYHQAQPYPPQQGNSYQSQPYPQQGNSYQYQQQPPYPQQSNSYQYQQAYSAQGSPQQPPQPQPQTQQPPYPQSQQRPPSQYFQGQITAKQPEIPEPQEKILPSKVERPMPKVQRPKRSAYGKEPIKIVDPTEFFGEQKVRSKGELGVTAVDNMSDEQLAAQLARMEYGGKKKSRRSMKAATELEADYSNMPSDMLPTDT